MPLTLQGIGRILPEGLPPGEPDKATRERFERIEGRPSHPLSRAFLWSQYVKRVYRDHLKRVFEHFKVEGSPERITAPVAPSVGFFPLDPYLYTYAGKALPPAAHEIGYFFGAVLYDSRWNTAPIEAAVLPERAGRVMQFPISFLPHAPVDPANAASTAWAHDQSGAGGVLTCKHAITGLPPGSNVLLKSGANGRLAAFTDGPVDAAFIETQGGIPGGSQLLRVEDHPINGATVTVDFRSQGSTTGQILNSWYFADNPSAYNGQRVFIDCWGQRGDSGALVSTRQGDAVAIYTGTIKGNGTTQGMSQYLRQAVDLLNLNLFR